MATVLVGAYASDPSQIWPEKYKSCYWNFVTGWTCETADPPVVTPPPPDDSYSPPVVDNGAVSPNVLPVMSGAAGITKSGCGCCGDGPASIPLLSGPVSSPVSTAVVAGKPCGCGYTNREALLAVAVAFVFFAIIARKNG